MPFLTIDQVFNQISQKTSLGDALFLTTIKQYLPGVTTIISWDKEHLENKAHFKVLTPKDYLTNSLIQ
jgi:hypothetical protein